MNLNFVNLVNINQKVVPLAFFIREICARSLAIKPLKSGSAGVSFKRYFMNLNLRSLACILSMTLILGCERARDKEFITALNITDSVTPYHVSHRTNLETFSLVLIINSASCRNSDPLHAGAIFAFEGMPVGIMTVDKAGTRSGASAFLNMIYCPQSYWENNFPSKRADNVLENLSHFRKSYPKWNGSLFIIGAYEGALSAVKIAKLWPETKGLALLSIGSGLKDSTIFQKPLTCYNTGCSEDKFQVAPKLKEIFSADHSPSTTWNIEGLEGNKSWFQEMLAFDLGESIKEATVPILLVHAGRDYIIPVQNAETVKSTNPNIELKIFNDLDQGWFDQNNKSKAPDVHNFVRDWIKKLLDKTSETPH